MSTFQSVQLKEVVRSVENWNPLKAGTDETFHYIDLSAIDQDSKRIIGAREISCVDAPSRARQLVEQDDVLVATVRPNLNGVAMISSELHEATASTGFCVIRPDQKRLDPSYLFHWVKTEKFVSEMVRQATGASYPAVSDKIVLGSSIPLPSLPEQHRIAAILDKADALRARRREALKQLEKLEQSIFVEMFGDPISNPKGWPKVALQELCEHPDDIKCGPFGTQLAKSEFTTKGVPLWGIRNVNAKFLRPTEEFVAARTAERLRAYSVIGGDIVMTRKGTVGNCAIYPHNFPSGIMHSDLLRLRSSSKKCSPEFLSHQLHHSQDVERQLALISGGAVMPGINVSRLKSLMVLNPPLELQTRFGQAVEKIDTQKGLQLSALREIDSLFASIQDRAFRGEL